MHRPLILLFLLAAVSGCGRPEDDQISGKPELTQVSFDGAGAKDVSAKTAHGERISWALGCRGCHGKELQGKRFYELYASNLTREVPKYSDAQLERLIRGGVHPTGRDVWAMPSEIFQHLSDTDLAAITSYLRTLKPAGEPTGKPLPFEADAKKLIAQGKILPAAKSVIRDKFMAPADVGDAHSQGRYITMVTCAECHGPELKGQEGDTPNLIVAGGYSREEFEALMTKGILPGGRKFKNPLMGEVAQGRFGHFTPHERDALYAYLKARAEQPQ